MSTTAAAAIAAALSEAKTTTGADNNDNNNTNSTTAKATAKATSKADTSVSECIQCHVVKNIQTDYYKKQQKKCRGNGGGGICKECWDKGKRGEQKQKQKQPPTKRKLDDDDNDNNNDKTSKKLKVEPRKMLATKVDRNMLATFATRKSLPPPSPPLPSNSELIGTYDLIYYESSRMCCDFEVDDDDIDISEIVDVPATTNVKGKLEIIEKDWNGKKALYAKYNVDDGIDEKHYHDDDPHTQHTSGTMIEHVHVNEFDPSDKCGNGFNVLKYEYNDANDPTIKTQPKDIKNFIITRGSSGHSSSNWWNEFLSDDYEDGGYGNDHCGGTLKVIPPSDDNDTTDDDGDDGLVVQLNIEESYELEWDITMKFRKRKQE